jgi:hypothetical protein
MDCDFNNDAMICPICGFKAGGRDWHKNCTGPESTGPPRPTPIPPLGYGPGGELKNLFASYRLTGAQGCGCDQYAEQMDRWGVEGCREHRAEIVARLEAARGQLGWTEHLIATAHALKQVVAGGFVPSTTDPCGSLVDEAIRRAQAKQDKESG